MVYFREHLESYLRPIAFSLMCRPLGVSRLSSAGFNPGDFLVSVRNKAVAVMLVVVCGEAVAGIVVIEVTMVKTKED